MSERDWEARMVQRLMKECDCSLGTPHTQERAVRIVVEEAFDGALAAVGNPEGLPELLTILSYDPAEYGLDNWVERVKALYDALQIDEENLP